MLDSNFCFLLLFSKQMNVSSVGRFISNNFHLVKLFFRFFPNIFYALNINDMQNVLYLHGVLKICLNFNSFLELPRSNKKKIHKIQLDVRAYPIIKQCNNKCSIDVSICFCVNTISMLFFIHSILLKNNNNSNDNKNRINMAIYETII